MDKPTFLVLSIIISICLLEIFHVYLEAEIGVLNYHYASVLFQLDSVKYHNQVLKEKILKQEALSTIQENAQKQGFIKARYIYLQGE